MTVVCHFELPRGVRSSCRMVLPMVITWAEVVSCLFAARSIGAVAVWCERFRT